VCWDSCPRDLPQIYSSNAGGAQWFSQYPLDREENSKDRFSKYQMSLLKKEVVYQKGVYFKRCGRRCYGRVRDNIYETWARVIVSLMASVA